jgi:hypothetical protein
MSYRCEDDYPFYVDFLAFLSVVGIVLNSLCCVIHSRILKRNIHHGQMFKYLLIKSICDTLQFIFNSFGPFYYCKLCSSKWTYLIQIWNIWFNWYGMLIMQLLSGIFEVAASFDCFLTINKFKKFKFFYSSTFFYIVTIVAIVYSSIFYIYLLFIYEIVATYSTNSLNTTQISYRTVETNFSTTKLAKNLKFTHMAVRDIIILLLLLIINIFIFKTMRRVGKTKIRLQSVRVITRELTVQIRKREAEQRRLLLIFSIGFNYFIGHLPVVVYYLVVLFTLERMNFFWNCYYMAISLIFYSSYIFPIVFYYLFNRVFKSYINEKLLLIKTTLFCNF